MIEWLISSGRASVVSSAITLIAGFVVGGWYVVLLFDHYPWNVFTVFRLIGAAIGFSIGSGIAGTLFGVIAAIFDMQQSLRRIAKGGDGEDSLTGYKPRLREPTFD